MLTNRKSLRPSDTTLAQVLADHYDSNLNYGVRAVVSFLVHRLVALPLIDEETSTRMQLAHLALHVGLFSMTQVVLSARGLSMVQMPPLSQTETLTPPKPMCLVARDRA